MLLLLFILLGCLGLLILGAWCVSEGGDILGEKYDATILGGFIIAWLNTAPETIFFITALETNNPNFAVGAISGSVIVVSTVAVGACIVVGAAVRQTSIYLKPGVRMQAKLLLVSLVQILAMTIFGFTYLLGVTGVLLYMAFIAQTMLNKDTSSQPLDSEDTNGDLEMGAVSPQGKEEEEPTWKGFGFLAAGGVLIYFFSEPFINSVVSFGRLLNINPIVLAFFCAPVASEAPEILEAISLARKGKNQNINIAFSNLVGGTISKTTLLCGLLCFYSVAKEYSWISPSYTISMLLVIICAGAVGLFGFAANHDGNRGKLLLGLFLIVSFVQYLFSSETSLEPTAG
eukprot:gb/GECH01002988.1/.p1 GENE.gb/GECH01002988.1/~~gb/GECH01002988.1/.p1  ORF type:complete len:344 (+),score=67.67 gb/GECH01002988.1/:1-1032(+)